MAIKKSDPGKRLLKKIKEIMELKEFKKQFRIKKGKKFDNDQFNSMFTMENKKGQATNLKLAAKILEVDYESMDLLFEKPKPKIKAVSVPVKESNPKTKEKFDGIVLKINKMKKGEDLPKAIMLEIPTKKSQLSTYKNEDQKNWRVEIENEEVGSMLSLYLNEKEKEMLRTSKRVSVVLLVE